MSDEHGTSIYLGVSGADGSPLFSLPGDNDRKMSRSDFYLNFDKDGKIANVQFLGETYSPDEWNEMFENLDPQDADVKTDKSSDCTCPK